MKLKILVINQFFWPDSAATSQLLTDLTVFLVGQGHQVSAICADGSYTLSTASEAPPVSVHRIRTLPFSRGKVGRIFSYLSFYVAAALRGVTLPKHDLVLTLTTPPLLCLIGTMIKFLRGSRHFIWEMDLYPDVAVDLQYFKAGGLADKSVGTLADFSRRRSDGVIALGECMKDRMERRGIPREQIFVADNWADSSAIYPIPRAGNFTDVVLLYSGNLGLAHDIYTIAGAMEQLRDDRRFRFLFVGHGSRSSELTGLCSKADIPSVEFRPFVQRASLSESLSAGDIGLVTQLHECCGSVVPSKVYGLLAAGRPILFIGPRKATPARIIRRFSCGWHVECGDVAGLTALLLHLADHPEVIRRAAIRARETLVSHYDLPLGVARIAGFLGALSPLQSANAPAGYRDVLDERTLPST